MAETEGAVLEEPHRGAEGLKSGAAGGPHGEILPKDTDSRGEG